MIRLGEALTERSWVQELPETTAGVPSAPWARYDALEEAANHVGEELKEQRRDGYNLRAELLDGLGVSACGLGCVWYSTYE